MRLAARVAQLGEGQMRKLLNRLVIVSLIGLPIAAAAALPAGASTGGIHYRTGALQIASSSKIPNSNIVGAGKKAVFKPSKLKAKEDTSGNDCSTGYDSFTIENTGSKTAYLAFNGKPSSAASIPPGEGLGICLAGGSAGDKETIGLTNSAGTKLFAATLVVTETD